MTIVSVHEGNRPCGYSTMTKVQLNIQVNRKHESEKWSHNCQYCILKVNAFKSIEYSKRPEHDEKK